MKFIIYLFCVFKGINIIFKNNSVASTGIEPVSGASETLILSIVLRGQILKGKEPNIKKQIPKGRFDFGIWLLGFVFCYFTNPPTFAPNTFTAMASNITPKNFRTAIKPAGPKTFCIQLSERNTR